MLTIGCIGYMGLWQSFNDEINAMVQEIKKYYNRRVVVKASDGL